MKRSAPGESPREAASGRRAFELGQIVATPDTLVALKKAGQQSGEFLTRHVNREWGDVPDEDRKENEYSLEHGFRLLSAYRRRRNNSSKYPREIHSARRMNSSH